MLIALLAPGNSVHTVRWANAFTSHGNGVHLITQHPPLSDLDPLVQVHIIPHFKGVGYLLNGQRLRRLIRNLRPDVVNAHYATGYGTLARSCTEFPVVLNVWGSDVYDFPQKGGIHRWLLCGNLRRADRIVSTSKAMAERTASICKELPPITVVPFGVDMELFYPGPPVEAHHVVTIGTVKRLELVYGVDLLIEAFIRLCRMEGLPPLKLRIVGGGGERERLERIVSVAGLADRVHFAGELAHAQVVHELQKFDVYVALSREESFGVAVIEASACGIPVVVSDVGGLPEVVMEGVTGRVVPPNDGSSAASAIAELVLSKELRHNMGVAGREFVATHFEWNQCVEKMIGVLMETINVRQA